MYLSAQALDNMRLSTSKINNSKMRRRRKKNMILLMFILITTAEYEHIINKFYVQ